MISRISIALCLALVVGVPAAQEPAPQTEDDKMLYTLGMALSRRLAEYSLTPNEAAVVGRGFMDGLTRREAKVDFDGYAERMESYFGERVRKIAAAERLAGDAYRETLSRKKGVIATGTGLVFQEHSAGSGDRPAPGDTARVKLTGKLRSGEVFLEQADQPLDTATAIPCVREGLARMRAGGKATLVCPPDLAYGNRGAAPHILPGATVIYEVELISVRKGTP